MAELAQSLGVERSALVLEPTAENTWDSARECAVIIRRHGWRRVLLISDAYHLPRSLWVFRRFWCKRDRQRCRLGGGCCAAYPAGLLSA